LYNIL